MTCSLTGTAENASYFSWYLKGSSDVASATVGVLTASCQIALDPININLYEYTCPNSRQSTWTIKKVTRQNHGDRYQCNIATSSGNQNSGYTFLNVQVAAFGEVVLTPVNTSMSENDPATLTCTLNGTTETAIYYSWNLKRSSEAVPLPVGIFTSLCISVIIPINTSLYDYACPNSRQSTWTIKKVTRQNHGDRYQCNIETPSGNQNSGFTFLNVEVPVSSVSMNVPSSSAVTVRENTEQQFKCKTSGGRPAAKLTWYKDSGTPNVSADDVEISSNNDVSSSTVNGLIEVTSTLRYSPRRNDNGWRIYCAAKNIPDMTPAISERKPLLNVQYPPDGPPVITGYADGGEYRVIEGTQGQLSCSVSGGNPEPTLTWDCYNSGTPNTTSTGTVTKTHSWVAERGQDKTCTCRASHYSGNTEVSIRIQILYAPTEPTVKIKSTTVSGTVKVIKNNPLSVKCISLSEPSPSYKWTYPNRDTSDGQQLNVSSLKSDGKYTCDVQNTMKPSVGAAVTDPPAVGELTNRSVAEGSQVTVTCPVIIGNPPETTFEWRRNGQVLETTQDITIGPASRTDAMFYSCTVANNMQQTGEQPVSQPDTKFFFLNVWYKTAVSSFSIEGHDGQSDVIVAEHDVDIQFTCVVDSNPASTVRIMLDGNVLKEESNTKSLSFIRSNVACIHGGVYTCEGSNIYGQPSNKSLNLFVKCSPRPLHRMKQNITSSLHAPVTLSFTALAYPEPGPTGFQWHKENGEEWTPVLSNEDLRITSSAIKSNLTILNVSMADYGRYRLNITNSIGNYVQYLFLSQKGSSNICSCNAETDTTGMILGIILGIVCAVLAVYAASLTVLYRRKTTRKDASSTKISTEQTTYVNLNVTDGQGSQVENKQDTVGKVNVDEDDTARQYTDLVRYSPNEDRTTYEVIQTAS